MGRRALAATAVSPTYPDTELSRARDLAKHLGSRHLIVRTHEFHDPAYRVNPPNRCYFCKKDLFKRLKEIASQEGLQFGIDGSNTDDLGDFRPGRDAARELGVRSPFVELGFGKAKIRRMAKDVGLSNRDQPSQACLAARIPYGEEITWARLEVPRDQLEEALESKARQRIIDGCKEVGYTYVCLDLDGYPSGAMNEAPAEKRLTQNSLPGQI